MHQNVLEMSIQNVFICNLFFKALKYSIHPKQISYEIRVRALAVHYNNKHANIRAIFFKSSVR